MSSNRTSWRRAASRSCSPAACPHLDRDRSRERRWPADDLGDARHRRTDSGRGYADAYWRPDDRDLSTSARTGHRAHSASARDRAQRRTNDHGDRRPDARRAVEVSGHGERWHDARSAHAPSRRSDSLSASHRHDDRPNEPRRDRQGVASRPQGDHYACRAESQDNRTAHPNAPPSSARGAARHDDRVPMGTNRASRPSAMQIELNKRIVASRDAESILAIVEKDHGAFNAVNAATACNRLAKTRHGSSRSRGWMIAACKRSFRP